ncbi:WD repeat-containing protein 83 [Chamberlinius hualienensis]
MDLPTTLVRSVDCKQGAVRAIRFNVDGNYGLSCGSDKTLKLWNPHRGSLLKTYMGHGYEVLDAQGSCDSSCLVSCGMDKTVMLWDVTSGQVLKIFRGHLGRVSCVRFNEDSTVAVSGSIDGTIRCWDCKGRKNEPIQVLEDAKDSITSVQVSDHEILSGSVDGHVRRYDLRMGQLFSDYVGATSVSSVSFTRDGQCILISCMNSKLKLFDKSTADELAEYKGHRNSDYRIDSCLSSTDAEVVSGSEDSHVYLWSLVNQNVVAKLSHMGSRVVHSLSYHPNLPCLLTATEGKFHLWKSEQLANQEEEEEDSE